MGHFLHGKQQNRPASSKWPCDNPNGGHWTGSLKKSLGRTNDSMNSGWFHGFTGDFHGIFLSWMISAIIFCGNLSRWSSSFLSWVEILPFWIWMTGDRDIIIYSCQCLSSQNETAYLSTNSFVKMPHQFAFTAANSEDCYPTKRHRTNTTNHPHILFSSKTETFQKKQNTHI